MTVMEWVTGITSILAMLTTLTVTITKVTKTLRKATEKYEILESLPDRLSDIDGNLKTIMDADVSHTLRLDRMEGEISANERDRLKHIIFEYGNRVRRKECLSGEEFRYLQQVFEKYTSLDGNGIAHDEYELIRDCYNDQEVT